MVLGDNVNTSARMYNSAKKMQILISGPTYVRVKDVVNVNFLDNIVVKGKKEPIKIFEVLDMKELKSKILFKKNGFFTFSLTPLLLLIPSYPQGLDLLLRASILRVSKY